MAPEPGNQLNESMYYNEMTSNECTNFNCRGEAFCLQNASPILYWEWTENENLI